MLISDHWPLRLFQRRSIVDRVLGARLTYLDRQALLDLQRAIQAVEEAKISGVLIEAGCALGGSAIVMAASKAQQRRFVVYDVFGMIPPPSDRDGPDVHKRYATIVRGESQGIGGGQYYGYTENLFDKVVKNFKRLGFDPAQHGVSFVKGLFQDTMRADEPVALAHIDGDWYDSVTTCLERLAPALQPGGRLIIDDYYAWSGCEQAVDDYFRDKMTAYDFERHARLHIVRR